MEYELKTTMEHLEENGIKTYFLETKEEVVPLIKVLVEPGSNVSNGGSVTLCQTGVIDLLKSGYYNYIDRDGRTGDDLKECYLQAFSCDAYFCSSNAITENGELYNVDGNSNRVACILYGPKQVIMVVGKNKIVKNIEESIERVKNIAAPLNAKRLNCKTPCAYTGKCISVDHEKDFPAGCNGNDRICCNYVISAHQRIKDRIKVIIVNEDLGY